MADFAPSLPLNGPMVGARNFDADESLQFAVPRQFTASTTNFLAAVLLEACGDCCAVDRSTSFLLSLVTLHSRGRVET